MIAFPKTVDEVLAVLGANKGAAIRAGATDLQERRELGIQHGLVVDLRDVEGIDAIERTKEGGLRIGAGVTVQRIRFDPQVRAAYPGLAGTARGLATPQIRARATLGGNLLQEVRCWYYRTPAFTCLKKGGATCLAREGLAEHHAVFDNGPCVAAHPSTLAVALLALDAQVEVAGGEDRSMADLLGDGKDAQRTHSLEEGAMLTGVVLPPPLVGWQSAYKRSIQRSRSEWPLVEAYVAVKIEAGTIRDARIAVGGVANRPLRLTAVEGALAGKTVDGAGEALAKAIEGAKPLQTTAFKVPLIPVTLADTLAAAVAAPAAKEVPK